MQIYHDFDLYRDRVTREAPCEICGRPDWCSSNHSTLAVCARIASDFPFGQAGWMHRLDQSLQNERQPISVIRQSRQFISNGKYGGRTPDSIYHYNDKTGRPLYRKLRFNKGTLDPERKVTPFERYEKGRWIGGRGCMRGVCRVPYRLEQFLHFQRIFVVEGEKCADALWDFGLPATCNDDGAEKWRHQFSELLAGKDIVILPDNDEPGRRHGEMVAGSLWGKARSVKLIELPGLGPAEDVFDWLMRNGEAL